MELTERLKNAGVSDDSIAKLEKEDLLDEDLLRALTADQLKSSTDMTLGQALRIVKAVSPAATEAPAAQTAAQSPTAPTPVTVVLSGPKKKTPAEILAGVAAKEDDAIEEARALWGNRSVCVTNSDGTLDVAATVEAIKFLREGQTDRFKNTAGDFVRLISMDELLNNERDLHPITGELLVPGEPMSELSEEQRLLIAYAIERGDVSPRDDEDALIDQVSRKTARWRNLEVDLKADEKKNTPVFQAASRRLRGTPSVIVADSPEYAGPAAPVTTGRSTGSASTGSAITGGGRHMDLEEFHAALLSAFPTASSLEQMLAFQLNTTLSHIASTGAMSKTMLDVIKYFERHSMLIELLRAARTANPGNASLRQFANKHGQ